MIKYITAILVISSFLILYSCSERPSVDNKKEGMESARKDSGNGGMTAGEGTVRIVFELHGDDIGSPEAQAILHKIITSIKASKAGEVLSSGFGMGNMEIVVKVEGEASIMKIERIITDNYPEANYSITSR